MIVSSYYRIGLEDVNVNTFASNKALLKIMEEAGGFHSSDCGTGLLDIEKTGCAWVLLYWRLEVFKRPKYGDEIKIDTWSGKYDKVSAIRDFEIFNKSDELIAIGSSKWIYMDISKRRPVRLTDEIIAPFESEPDKATFSDNRKRIEIPDIEYKEKPYIVLRRDVDKIGHMHNLTYVDAAYEILSDEEYFGTEFNEMEIEFRKEILLGMPIISRYYRTNDGYVVTFSHNSTIHSVVKLGKQYKE